MKSKRQLNFELLRIISMLIIILFHFSDWGKLMYINPSVSISNKFFGEFINMGGSIGVDIFILISGYFLIDSKFSSKKIFKIILEVLFYSISIYIICVSFNIVEFNINDLKTSILPISYSMYWFATLYVVMYILSPFLNFFINKTNEKQHKVVIVVLMLFISIIPTLLFDSNIIKDNLTRFIFLYIVAAYINKYVKKSVNKKVCILSAISCVLILFLLSVLYTLLGMNGNISIYNTMTSLPMLVLVVSIFLIFKDLRINKNNEIIMFFSKASFGVYLIHINIFFINFLMFQVLHIHYFYSANTLILILYVIVNTLIIYICCTFIDTLRRKVLEEPLFKLTIFDKYFEKIDSYMNIFN